MTTGRKEFEQLWDEGTRYVKRRQRYACQKIATGMLHGLMWRAKSRKLFPAKELSEALTTSADSMDILTTMIHIHLYAVPDDMFSCPFIYHPEMEVVIAVMMNW